MSTHPSGPYKPVTYGRDYNFYAEKTIASSVFGADTAPDGYSAVDGYNCNAFIWFKPEAIILVNKSTAVVEYSFNGTTVHGELDGTAGSPTKSLTFYTRIQNKIWFRVKSGGPGTIQIHSWATP